MGSWLLDREFNLILYKKWNNIYFSIGSFDHFGAFFGILKYKNTLPHDNLGIFRFPPGAQIIQISPYSELWIVLARAVESESVPTNEMSHLWSIWFHVRCCADGIKI